MGAFRLIPCLDVHHGQVVKGVRFQHLRPMGEPVALAQRFRQEGADELVFLDISASVEGRQALLKVVRQVAEVLDIPFCVGGGVRSLEDAMALIAAGADKVAVNSAAVASPTLLRAMAEQWGRQSVVLAIDARRTSWGFEVVTHGGGRPTGKDAVAWAEEGASLGAGEVLLTSIDRDGTGEGYDQALIAAVRGAVDVPIVASGGGKRLEDFLAAYRAGADAALAATIFHQQEVPIPQLKKALMAAGVPVCWEEGA